jgi:hypothetical protein
MFFIRHVLTVFMNKRFIIVGILLGIVVAIAFYVGSPIFLGMG